MYFVRSSNVCEMYDFALGGGGGSRRESIYIEKIIFVELVNVKSCSQMHRPIHWTTQIGGILCRVHTYTISIYISTDIFQNSFNERIDSVYSDEIYLL